MSEGTFTPGTLVNARGREWLVLTGGSEDTLRVRPITGSEEDQPLIYLPLETEPVRETRFPPPLPDQGAGHDAAGEHQHGQASSHPPHIDPLLGSNVIHPDRQRTLPARVGLRHSGRAAVRSAIGHRRLRAVRWRSDREPLLLASERDRQARNDEGQ